MLAGGRVRTNGVGIVYCSCCRLDCMPSEHCQCDYITCLYRQYDIGMYDCGGVDFSYPKKNPLLVRVRLPLPRSVSEDTSSGRSPND